MKFPRRAFMHLAVGAAALPAMSGVARAQAYPSRAGTHRRRLSRRRGDRHHGAPDGRMADGAPRPAIHRREQARRQRQHRNRDGRQGTRGWLHAAAGRDPECDQCRALQQSQFRLHPGHRAGHLPRAAGLRRRGESVGPRHDAPRVHRLRQGQPGQDQLRVGRARARRKTLPASSSR